MIRDIIVIGASSGGIDALRTLVGSLPHNFRAAIFVVNHVSPTSPGILGDILTRAGELPAVNPGDGERIQPGRIYVAPPDHHMLIEPGIVRITRGPRENRFRPAVDPLFRSAAQTYGPRVIGIILTGNLDDGSAGLWAVKRLGGTAIVQDPKDALYPSMPRSAMSHVKVDYCIPLQEIAPLLVNLTVDTLEKEGALMVPEEIQIEVNIAKEHTALDAGVMKLGDPSIYVCPECNGVLLQLKEEDRVRFRCHTGHAYSAESLMASIHDGVEDALWNAVRCLEENILLMQQLATLVEKTGNGAVSNQLILRVEATRRQVELVREAVKNHELQDI
jgi:two-component system chemotaxis response regulator CheB